MALLTLTEFKKYKPDIASGADTRIQKIIDAVEKYFLMRIKRNIEEVTHTDELYDGDSTGELILNNYPITEFTTLKVKLNDAWEVIDSDDYVVYLSSGRVKLKDGGIFYTDLQNVSVTYKSGFTEITQEIEMALAEIVSRKYEQFDKKGDIFSSEAFAGGSIVIKEEDLTDFARDVINNYKKKGIKRN